VIESFPQKNIVKIETKLRPHIFAALAFVAGCAFGAATFNVVCPNSNETAVESHGDFARSDKPGNQDSSERREGPDATGIETNRTRSLDSDSVQIRLAGVRNRIPEEVIRAYTKLAAERRYSLFFKRLHIPPEKSKLVIEIISDLDAKRYENIKSGTNTKESRTQMEGERRSRLSEVLTSHEIEEFYDFKSTSSIWRKVEQLSQTVAVDAAPLSDSQMTSLHTLLKSETIKKIAPSGQPRQQGNLVEKNGEALLEKAKEFLSPVQIDALKCQMAVETLDARIESYTRGLQ
jgi:hypothetical protein